MSGFLETLCQDSVWGDGERLRTFTYHQFPLSRLGAPPRTQQPLSISGVTRGQPRFW